MQKTVNKNQGIYGRLWSLPSYLANRITNSHTLYVIPFVSFFVSCCFALFVRQSETLQAILKNYSVSIPSIVENWQFYLYLPVFIAGAIVFYFYIDYQQHYKPLKQEDKSVKYKKSHHAKAVFIPKIKHNSRQIALAVLYVVANFLIIALTVAFLTAPVLAYAADEYVTTWKTNNPGFTASNQVSIDTASGYTYNFDIDWGDGNTNVNVTNDITHTYAVAGTYEIIITGTFPKISQNADRTKLISVEQWGNNQWETMNSAFNGTTNLQINALDSPNLSNVTNMSVMFNDSGINSDISSWDVSNVTNMNSMFESAENFNQNIDSWDVSSVTDMSSMFDQATAFNQPLSSWDVSSVTDMHNMFADAENFNQNIDSWDVSSVTDMSSMFAGRQELAPSEDLGYITFSNFNKPLNSWDVSSVNDMSYMFFGAKKFNQPLSSWDVSNVTNMASMFLLATNFNKNIDSWDVSSVTDINTMFGGAVNFNQSLASWDVSNVTNMDYLFAYDEAFNQSLASWDVSNVTTMSNMLVGTGLLYGNYDATLVSWSAQALQNNVVLDAGATYCNSGTERQSIIDTFNWTINDGGLNCTSGYKTVLTSEVGTVNRSTASLQGRVFGPGRTDFVSGGFQWGATTSYGKEEKNLPIVSNIKFSKNVNVTCGQDYNYRAFAVDAQNVRTYGSNYKFNISCSAAEDTPAPGASADFIPRQDITTNDIAEQSVRITSPKNDEVFPFGKTITLSAVTSGIENIRKVDFYINSNSVGSDSSKPYQIEWNNSSAGDYIMEAIVTDINGEKYNAERVSFTVRAARKPVLGAETTANNESDDDANYVVKGVISDVGRNSPWILLQIIVIFCLLNAFRQSRQNQTLKRTLLLTTQTKNSLGGFLDIVSHYLGTATTVMSSAIESVIANPGAATVSTVASLTATSKKLKAYTNNAVANIDQETSQIQQQLKNKPAPKDVSIFTWVLLPSVIATVMMVVSLLGMSNLSVWSADQGEVVFSISAFAGTLALVFVGFRVWQNQRRLQLDLLATTHIAEDALQLRRKFIINNQEILQDETMELEQQAETVADPKFKKRFNSGLSQFKEISDSFTSIYQLTSSTITDPIRAYIPMKRLLKSLQEVGKARNIKIDYELEPRLRSQLNSDELEEAVNTLVGNAVKFSNDNGNVEVKAYNKGKWFVLTVIDHGKGIDPKQLNIITQPFTRGTSTETYNYEGLGLSLYITRLIAEKYKGTLKIDSTLGKGTTVTLKAKMILQ